MMLLVISERARYQSNHLEDGESFKLVVKRTRDVRENWVKYYEDGNRLFRLSRGSKYGYALLKRKPQVDGASIAFEVELFKIAEVWGGRDGELCSVFCRVNGITYRAASINGWEFVPYTETRVSFSDAKPSDCAETRALDFLKKHYGQTTNQSNERQTANTTVSPGLETGTNNPSGSTQTSSILL